MEPIGHEGLGRLLKLEDTLQTPHVVFSHADLEESNDLESGGTIKVGKVFDLPPSPLGLDSDKRHTTRFQYSETFFKYFFWW